MSFLGTTIWNAGRSSDGENVPVSVDCGYFHYVEPEFGWTTDYQTDTVDSRPATENPQQPGHVATGRADNDQSSYTEGQGQVPGDGEPLTPIHPDKPSTEKYDNTGNVD